MVHRFEIFFLRDCDVTSHDFPNFPVLYSCCRPRWKHRYRSFSGWEGLRKLWRNFPTAPERVGDSSLGAQAQLCCASHPRSCYKLSFDLKDLDKRLIAEDYILNSFRKNFGKLRTFRKIVHGKVTHTLGEN